MQVVAKPKWAHFRDGKKFAARRGGGEPGFHRHFHERNEVEKLRRQSSAPIRHGHLAVMTVEGAEMKLLRALNQIRAHTESQPEWRLQMLDDGEMRVVPRHGQQFAGGLLVTVGQRIGFLRRLGAGVAMNFDGGLQTKLLALGNHLPRQTNRDGRRHVVIGELDVDVRCASVLLRAERRSEFTWVAGGNITHSHQAEFVRELRVLGSELRAEAIEVRVLHRAQWHEPDSQRRSLDEKERHQLEVFGLAQRPQHAHSTHERRGKGKAIESREELSSLSRAGEIAAFGLRMNAGWPFEQFQRIAGNDLRREWSGEMNRLVGQGWGSIDRHGFRLTRAGLRFADSAAELFLR